MNIDQLIAQTQKNLDDKTRRIMIEVGARLVMRSPVGDASYWNPPTAPKGYAGGRFKANWQHGFGDYPSAYFKMEDKTGHASESRMNSGVNRTPAAGIHYFVNNVPYARRIEDGWSRRQAPKGVVKLTSLEWHSIVEMAGNS